MFFGRESRGAGEKIQRVKKKLYGCLIYQYSSGGSISCLMTDFMLAYRQNK